MDSIWKSVKGYEDKYSVSNLSEIRSEGRTISTGKILKPTILKQRISKDGYIRVKLYKNAKQKTFYLHRLIANAFLGESELDVNHKDGNKANNKLSNLEYLTRSENHLHAYKNGLKVVTKEMRRKFKHNLDSTHIKQQKPVLDISTGIKYDSITEAAKAFGVCHHTMRKRINNNPKLILTC